jgi:hypothetical protein
MGAPKQTGRPHQENEDEKERAECLRIGKRAVRIGQEADA